MDNNSNYINRSDKYDNRKIDKQIAVIINKKNKEKMDRLKEKYGAEDSSLIVKENKRIIQTALNNIGMEG